MLAQIITRTPVWVWVLLLALLWLGASQMLTRSVTLRRVTVLPVAMTGLSLYGTLSVFGSAPAALSLWLAAAGASAVLTLRRPLPEGTRFDTWTRRFTLPGSVVPLIIIVGIFVTKYAVGVALGINPSLAQDAVFALSVSAVYGVFSGIFMARSIRLWNLARASEASPAGAA